MLLALRSTSGVESIRELRTIHGSNGEAVMALLTVEGVYEDGKIELEKCPADVKRARVLATFVAESETAEEESGLRRREAGERLLVSMRQGLNFGGENFNREEIYEERLIELEARRAG